MGLKIRMIYGGVDTRYGAGYWAVELRSIGNL